MGPLQRMLFILSFCFLGWLLINPQALLATDSWWSFYQPIQQSEWRTLIDFRTNAFLSWRADPIAELFGHLIFPVNWSNSYHLTLLLIFWAGLAVFLTSASSRRATHGIAGATLTTLWIASSVAGSTIIWGAIAWIPWLAFSILLGRRGGDFPAAVFIVFFALRTVAAAAHLAPLAMLCAAGLAYLPEVRQVTSARRAALAWWTGGVLLGATILFLAQVKQAPFPDYPPNARLLPEAWWSGFIHPLFGFDYPLPLVNRPILQATLLWPFVGLLCISAATLWMGRASVVARRSASAAMALAMFGLWDSVPLQELWQISPIAALSRMLPGLFLTPVSLVFYCIAALPLALAITARLGHRLVTMLIATTFILSLPLLRSPNSTVPAEGRPVQTSASSDATAAKPAAPNSVNASQVPTREPSDWEAALLSPSHYVTRFFGRRTLATEYSFSAAQSEPIAPFLKNSFASIAPQALPLLMDGDPSTRYSTERAYQDGSEVLVFWFKTPQALLGIELDPGSYFTDFPRGVEVRGDINCSDSPELAGKDAPVLARFTDWQGPPKRTPSGLPYFGKREDVRIPFTHPATIECLRIQQIGQAPRFDLSIVEAGLIRAR